MWFFWDKFAYSSAFSFCLWKGRLRGNVTPLFIVISVFCTKKRSTAPNGAMNLIALYMWYKKTDSYIISGILEFVHCFRSQSVVLVWAFSRNEEWRNKWKKTDLCVIIPTLPPPKLVTGRRCINCGKSDVFYCRCHGWYSLPLYHQMVRWWQIAGN